MEKESTYEELKKMAAASSKKHFEEYLAKTHDSLMMARNRRQQFENNTDGGLLPYIETNPMFDEISPVKNFIEKCYSDIVRKENEQVENILRNWIDDPIIGPITDESLKQRCVRAILYKESNMMDSQFEQSGNNFTIKLTSRLLGVVQGDFLIGINGERYFLTDEQIRRLFKMGV